MKLFYIHGANATPRSFTYLQNNIDHPAEFADYNSKDGFYNNLNSMKEQLATGNWFVITHSLGGIYAAHLIEYLGTRLKGTVTISAPYGGSELCDVLMLVHPFTRLFRDTGTRSKPIVEAQQLIQKTKPNNWTAIVTSTGPTAYLPIDNDGVISVKSQECLNNIIDTVALDANHYEIVQDDRVVEIIQDRLRLALPYEKKAKAVV
jgi:pimeloyl-ACP methyl ester carboxylesterase